MANSVKYLVIVCSGMNVTRGPPTTACMLIFVSLCTEIKCGVENRGAVE